ncbi:hypothetical protein [Lysobacter silvisoli]|uniref:VCBS repeat-containing protein n=1 Tax=Lysobacter silvisoli TaxID=2293254 RepID=A0A371K618_9GAMM|nr:hypothetical protein [Lysobacter silvisoli]RDZ29310.1 hypothetical protein DX914_09570 [Lysobacter silvisoli]
MRRDTYFAVLGLGLWFATGAAMAAEPALCAALRAKPAEAGRLGERLEEFPDSSREGSVQVPNVDLDGDGISDRIVLWRSDSPSRFPADLAEAQVVFSASGRNEERAFPHIAVRRYRSQVYLTGMSYADDANSAQLEVLLLDRRGVTNACSVVIPVK